MYEKNILKQAVVLLLIALMIVSSGAVVAKTSTTSENLAQKEAPMLAAPLVWDNVIGVHGSLGGIIVATVGVVGAAYPADDFKLDTDTVVNAVFWQGGYFICQLATGQHDYNWDWRILFWSDDVTENHPGSVIYNQTIPNADIYREFWYNYTRPSDGYTYWVANYSVALPVPFTFSANTRYWITFQAIQGSNTYPYGAWSRHNATVGGVKLHEGVFKGVSWGYSDWVNLSVLTNINGPHDLNFQLFGEEAGDTTPPVTTCNCTGTNPVTVTLTATDDDSGVNYTKYKLDSGIWTTYIAPFTVTDVGNHIIYYYSVDKAGNIETEKNCSFTVEAPPITITIKGGFGVSATIKNTGTTDLTNINWTINLDGKLIIVGKSKSDTIASLAVGNEVKVKDFVIGFGKTGIAVTAGDAEASASGTAFLFFVFGVT